MCTLGRIINIIKESEIDRLSTPWVIARTFSLLSRHRMAVSSTDGMGSALMEAGQCHGFRKLLRAWWKLHTSPQWILRVAFGRSKWPWTHSSILPSLLSLPTCLLASPNCQQLFSILCRICWGELNLTYCIIYLDNVIVFSHTEEEHLECLCIMFEWFCKFNLKLKPSKCSFFQSEIVYLAHHVLQEGIHPSKDNVCTVKEFPMPETYTQVHAFCGFWAFTGTLSRDSLILHGHFMMYWGRSSILAPCSCCLRCMKQSES